MCISIMSHQWCPGHTKSWTNSVKWVQASDKTKGTRSTAWFLKWIPILCFLISTNSQEKQQSFHGAMRPSPRSHSWPSAGWTAFHSCCHVAMLLTVMKTNARRPCWWLQQNVHHQNCPFGLLSGSRRSRFSYWNAIHLWQARICPDLRERQSGAAQLFSDDLGTSEKRQLGMLKFRQSALDLACEVSMRVRDPPPHGRVAGRPL